MKNTLLATAGMFAILLVSVLAWWQGRDAKETIMLAREDIVEFVDAEGKVVSAENIDVGSPIDGRVARIHVKPGDAVARDQVIISFDTDGFKVELQETEAKVRVGKLKLAQLLSGVSRQEVALLDGKVAAASVAIENAHQKLEDEKILFETALTERYAFATDYADTVLLNAENAVKALRQIYDEHGKFRGMFLISDSQKRSEAEWQMSFAGTALENVVQDHLAVKSNGDRESVDLAFPHFKTNLEVIRSSLQKTAELLESAETTFGSPEIAGFRTTVAVQRSVVNTTQTALLTLEQDIAAQKIALHARVNNVDREVKQAEADLHTAENELALAEAQPRETEIAILQAELHAHESRVSGLQDKMRRASVASPAAGVIGEIRVRVGETAAQNKLLLSIAPSARVQVEARVPDSALHVAVGNPVFIFGSGGAIFSGSVGRTHEGIASVYMHQDLDPRELPEKVAVRIRTLVREGALLVPRQFVFGENGQQRVWVEESGKKTGRAVLAGMAWHDKLEILEGVSEGDFLVHP